MTMCTRSRRLWRLAVPLPIFFLLQLLPTKILVSSSPESSQSRGVPGWVSQPCGTHRGDTSVSCVGHVPLLLISAAVAESGLPSLVATDDLSATGSSVVVAAAAAATADESSSAAQSAAGDKITSAGAAIVTQSSPTALVAAAPTESSPSSAAAIPSTASSSSSVTSMHLRRLRAVYVHGYSQGAGTSTSPGPGGRPRKLFSWGDFSASVRTSRLQLLITAKMVDHGNGSVSVHFRHNATGRGSVSVSLGPPTVPLCLTPHRPLTSQQQQQERQNYHHHQQQQQCSDNQQWDHNQQNQQQHQQQAESKAPRDTEPFRCRVEYEKVDRALKSVPCIQPRRSGPASLSPGPGIGPGQSAGSVPGPGSSCYREQVQSHVSWICSKPVSAFCIYVAFQGANYRLAHKVCPDLHMVRTPSG